MSGLKSHELCMLLDRKLTLVEIRARKGPSERILQMVRADPGRQLSAELHASLEGIAAEVLTFPWPDDVGERIRRIHELRKSKQMAALRHEFRMWVTFAVDHLTKFEMGEDACFADAEWRLGLRYLVAHYFTALANHGNSADRPAEARAAAIHHFRMFDAELADAAYRKDARYCTNLISVLRFKALNNMLALEWDRPSAGKAGRDAELQALVERGFVERAKAYNDLIPKEVGAPFNALLAASVLRQRDLYPDLHARLVRADASFADPNAVTDDDFDADFADFTAWWNEKGTE